MALIEGLERKREIWMINSLEQRKWREKASFIFLLWIIEYMEDVSSSLFGCSLLFPFFFLFPHPEFKGI
jgi:hypothetical protein